MEPVTDPSLISLTTTPDPSLVTRPIFQPILSDTIAAWLDTVLRNAAFSSLSYSLVLNLTNVIVFLRMGISDVMTRCLLALSVTDSIELVLGNINLAADAVKESTYVQRLVDIYRLQGWLIYSTLIFQNISINITILTSIERCLCIVMPFKQKVIATKKNTNIALLIIYVFGFILNFPNFFTATFVSRFNPMLNVTRVEIDFSSNRLLGIRMVETFNLMVFGPIACLFVTGTSIIMSKGLRRSAKFRASMMSAPSHPKTSTNIPGKMSSLDEGSDAEVNTKTSKTRATLGSDNRDDPSGGRGGGGGGGGGKTSTKSVPPVMSSSNIQLTKMLLAVCLVTLGYHVIAPFLAILVYIYPQISPEGLEMNLFSAIVKSCQIYYGINMSLNTFIYYRYNKKYRRTLLKVLTGSEL